MSFFKNVDTNLLLIGAVLGAGWWIQGGVAETRVEISSLRTEVSQQMENISKENAQMWMDAKKDSDERFYEQLKEIRAISERVAVIEINNREGKL